ncbi:MAG: NYN domain-containing protein [Shimia sp.]|uniref:NYN domain-containing protein n=1 Tax=Shimia sp. TaxID=1954381 RepID=UPI004059A2FA
MSDFIARPEAGFLIATLLVFLLAMFLLSRVLRFLLYRDRKRQPEPQPEPTRTRNTVIVDGSNVMYWKGGAPNLDTLIEVLDSLRSKNLKLGVMFDANAGYLVSEDYMHDGAFAMRLGLSAENVLVVPKGTPADATILLAARDMGARVVTNDQFRDWAEEYPEVAQEGFLIKGRYRKGKLWLGLGEAEISGAAENAPQNGGQVEVAGVGDAKAAFAIAAAELDPWPSKAALKAVLEAGGHPVVEGPHSLRVSDAPRFAFQDLEGPAAPSIEAHGDETKALVVTCRDISNTLSAANIRHRFEVYSYNDALAAYLHHDWPKDW